MFVGKAVWVSFVQTVDGGLPYKLSNPVTTIILLPYSFTSTFIGKLFIPPFIFIVRFL